MDAPDAVVVGAGPNGLAAAVTMAREGLRVIVLERAEVAGGALRSLSGSEPGLVHDFGAAVLPLAVASPVLSRWPLGRHGLRWIHPPLPLAHPLPGRPAARLERSLRATAAGLGVADEAWRALVGPVAESWEALAPDLMGPVLHVPAAPLALARFGARALLPASWSAAFLRDPAARALWAGIAAHAPLPFTSPATSAVPLVLAALGHRGGWPFPQGGAGRLTDALAGYLRSLGGEVRTGVPVRDLDDLPPARAVLLDLTPAGLLRVAAGRLPPAYERALRRYRPGEGVVKLDLAVEGGVPWTDPACCSAGTLHLGGSYDEIAAAGDEVARGRLPAAPFVLVAQPGRFDPTRATGTVQPVWAYAHLPQALSTDGEAVRTLAERIRARLERAAPGTAARTREVRVWGPVELARENPNLAGGDPSAGATTLDQLLGRPVLAASPYATPLAGIYLCSAATPPGPGVHGMSGFRAAQSALWREFGVRARLPPSPEEGAATRG